MAGVFEPERCLQPARPSLDALGGLFSRMDGLYEKAAAHYGFQCRGCDDNCCYSRFHHHTFLEYLYLYEGFMQLDTSLRGRIHHRAAVVCRRAAEAERTDRAFRSLCPLNFDGLCRLYAHRPMICRLHGLPHELHLGDRVLRSEGCEAFARLCGDKDYYPLDRTPLYRQMAEQERALKGRLGISDRIRMTVAEMLESFDISG